MATKSSNKAPEEVMKTSGPKRIHPCDVPADNPVGRLDRFGVGLRRVLAAPKPRRSKNAPTHHQPTQETIDLVIADSRFAVVVSPPSANGTTW
jgi:hypothetical protein